MATHRLHIRVTGVTPDDLEQRAADQLADYLGLGRPSHQARRLLAHTHLDVEPAEHLIHGSHLGYTAEAVVEIDPANLPR